MLLLQLYTIVIAAALAWINRIPCVKMNNYGASRKEEKEWHLVNPIIKGIIAAALCIRFDAFWNVYLIDKWYIVFFLLILIMWVVFDIVLAVLLHGRDGWYYLGDTAKIDKLLRDGIRIKKAIYRMGVLYQHEKRILGMGNYAGIVKFIVTVIVIVIINLKLL